MDYRKLYSLTEYSCMRPLKITVNTVRRLKSLQLFYISFIKQRQTIIDIYMRQLHASTGFRSTDTYFGVTLTHHQVPT